MKDKRLIASALLLPLTFLFSAAALASTRETDAAAQNAVPIVQDVEAETYVGIPIEIELSADDGASDVVLYQITEKPRLGEATISDSVIKYVPGQRTGKDKFSYTAVDAEGNTAKPASVTVHVMKNKAGRTYADMEGNPAHYASLKLAENGVMTGETIGECSFFRPAQTVTRSEFIMMTVAAAGLDITPTDQTDFADDSGLSSWSKPYVSAAAANGLINGYQTASGASEIRGQNTITVGEASVILNKLIASSVDGAEYAAASSGCGGTDWIDAAMGSLERMQVISSSVARLDADTPLTRQTACMMLCGLETMK